MPTRRIMELSVVVTMLVLPARQTVRTWGKRLLASKQEGSFMHGVGEVVVTVL